MYLNVHVPDLQYEQGIVRFFRQHRGQPLPSAALMSPMTRRFVTKLEAFVGEHGIPLVRFCKGQRKDEVMAEHLRRFARKEGIVFVGKAQENTPYPWIVRGSSPVNHYYIYAVDQDFGPFFPAAIASGEFPPRCSWFVVTMTSPLPHWIPRIAEQSPAVVF